MDNQPNSPSITNIIEVWKKVVDVQQHFNDLSLRIRNYALTLFTGIVGGVGLLQINNIDFNIGNFTIPASAVLCIIGYVVMYGFFYMDKYWYHRLLLGAVEQGEFIENKYANIIPEIGLAKSIRNKSPHKKILSLKKKNNRRDVRSSEKFSTFYNPLKFSLLLLGAGIIFYSNSNFTKSEQETKESIIHAEKSDTTISINKALQPKTDTLIITTKSGSKETITQK